MNRAVFLDRDGVVIKATHLVTKNDEIEIEKNAVKGVKILNSLGMKVIIVTNQPQVARGLCTEEEVAEINRHMVETLMKDGVKINAVYFCPHHPEQREDIPDWAKKYRIECTCRKPNTGMFDAAASRFDIDLKNSFMVGDRTVDILAGEKAGCKTILVKTGVGGTDNKHNVEPDFICNDLEDAANIIKRYTKVKAVILAGGRGERLLPLTRDLPKPMIDINGKSVLEHQIELLKNHGVTDIIICGNYLFDKIKDYFGSGDDFGVSIQYVEESEPLGTGGPLKNAEHLLDTEDFIVLNGDVATNLDVSALLKFHINKNGLGTLVVRNSDHPKDSDIVEIEGDGKIVSFLGHGQEEKRIGITGLAIFSRKILDFIPRGKSNLENDIIAKLIDKSDFYGYLSKDYIKDMGTMDRLEKVRKEFPVNS